MIFPLRNDGIAEFPKGRILGLVENYGLITNDSLFELSVVVCPIPVTNDI